MRTGLHATLHPPVVSLYIPGRNIVHCVPHRLTVLAFSCRAADAPTVIIHDTIAGADSPDSKHRYRRGSSLTLSKNGVWAFIDAFLVKTGRHQKSDAAGAASKIEL